MHKPRTAPAPEKTDRRSGEDRRPVEGQPPGKHDRRRGLESRKPEVVELDMSRSEWAALAEPPLLRPSGK